MSRCCDVRSNPPIEEFLEGPEVSVFAVCDGQRAVLLPSAQDFKRVGEGGTGPNTGGMGAVSPAPGVDAALLDRVEADVVAPVLAELASRGAPYVGVLYAGLVLTADGPRVLEFNARLGDPEAQAVLPRLTTPLAPLLAAAANGRVDQAPPVGVDPRPCVTVVLAAQGYPGAVVRGRPIEGVDAAAAREDVAVFHAGTAHDDAGGLVADGGRVLAVSALGDDVAAARAASLDAIADIELPGGFWRADIAAGH
ncbi:MAG: phosphoribosylamine--glycine ligase [Actinomycetota bacterium]